MICEYCKKLLPYCTCMEGEEQEPEVDDPDYDIEC